MDKPVQLQTLTDSFVAAHTVADWGQNSSGWFLRVLETPDGQYVAMRPPHGKIWRAYLPAVEAESTP